MINNCIKKLQNKLFLPSCLICNAPGHQHQSICNRCINQLKFNRHCCSRCSLPLAGDSQVLCPQCQNQAPQFHDSFIPFHYSGEMINLIRNFKFSANLISGKVLADLFCQELCQKLLQKSCQNSSWKLESNDIALPEMLVPVPLHPSRTRQRGFNQALWLAQKISQQTGIPVNHTLVSRQQQSKAQHQLNKQARLKNLKNAFKLESNPITDQNFPNHLAIIDDVVTTGATANALASLFNHKTHIRIQLWAIARTPLE